VPARGDQLEWNAGIEGFGDFVGFAGGWRGIEGSERGVLGNGMAWCGAGPFVVPLEVQRERVICSFVDRVDRGVETDDLGVGGFVGKGGLVGRDDLGCIVGLDAMMLGQLEQLLQSTLGWDS
jgi:hypothetical protein